MNISPQSNNSPSNSQIAREKTLYDVLRDVWKAKYYMLGFSVVMVIAAFLFLSLANNYYRAEMVIAPARPMGQSLISSSKISEGSSQIQEGDLQSSSAFLRFENMYNGVSVAKFLAQDKDIIAGVSSDLAFEFSKPKNDWNEQRLSEYLKKRVKLEPVSGTPLRRLIYLHSNEAFAADMVKRIHRITDEMIRARILVETKQRIEYLQSSISKTTNPEHRRSLANLLMEQERLKMMVSLDQPFAASIIEPAFVSSRPRWPDPYIIYSVFTFIGLLLGFVVYGLRHHE